jgi:hypothetical protein
MLFSIPQAEEIRQGVEEVNLFEDINQEGHQAEEDLQVVEDLQEEEDLQAEEDIPFQGNKYHRYHHHLQVVS